MGITCDKLSIKSSRICVKNLPKHVTLDSLKQHFSQKGELTDAKLLHSRDGKSRRTAFIGYRTEHEAGEAIRYFNNSYFHTSKITCEVCWTYGDSNIPRSWSRYANEKRKLVEKTNLLSRSKTKFKNKNSNKHIDIDDPKLQEFLHVMQPRTKSKIWADDPVARVNKSALKEGGMHVEKSAESRVSHDYIVSEMDYLEGRIRKEWSSSESDTDKNVTNISQNDDGPGQGNQEQQDIIKSIVSEKQESQLEGGFYDESAISGKPHCCPENAKEMLKSSRLYVHNLPYTTTEDDVTELCNEFGSVKEVHLVIDKETKRSRGFGYVLYSNLEEATRALENLRHSIFQGRMLHVVPAETRDASENLECYVSVQKGKTYKQLRQEKRKALEVGGDTRAWNSLFMNSDTIAENVARKFGISKNVWLNCEADDLAVRMALGETQVITETKKALLDAGVNVASLEEFASGNCGREKRSNHILLVKNLPFSSTIDELSKMFGKFGSLEKIILPPTRTLALVIFLEPADARAAFCLHYRRYRDAVLYVEWAPSNILSQHLSPCDDSKNHVAFGNQEVRNVLLDLQDEGIGQAEFDPDRVESRTLYVKNLNFKTTDETLGRHFQENMKEGKISSIRIVKHLKDGKNVSKGYGFVEFDSVETANNVCKALQGTIMDGHALRLQIVHPKKDVSLKKAESDLSSTKLIVKNVAYEATKKDLRQLFSPFGQVKSLRLPKKPGKHSGFAFVEYVTKQELQNALKALSNTHLYGRHLVLERAKEGETLEDLKAKTAARFNDKECRFQNPTSLGKRRKL